MSTRTSVHGVLLAIHELGVLIQGASGSGKSELALSFIAQGHQLVADDVVLLQTYGNQQLMGLCPHPIQDMLEIRGLGPIHIPDLYGNTSVTAAYRIDLLIHLVNNSHPALQENRHQGSYFSTVLLDIPIPSLYLPEQPVCSLTTLIDCAVRCEKQRLSRYNGQRVHDVANIGTN